jgi:hypothetical protein
LIKDATHDAQEGRFNLRQLKLSGNEEWIDEDDTGAKLRRIRNANPSVLGRTQTITALDHSWHIESL